MASPMPWPCCGPHWSVRRMSMSSVPCTSSMRFRYRGFFDSKVVDTLPHRVVECLPPAAAAVPLDVADVDGQPSNLEGWCAWTCANQRRGYGGASSPFAHDDVRRLFVQVRVHPSPPVRVHDLHEVHEVPLRIDEGRGNPPLVGLRR